jgi:hypothetical protein
MYNNLVERCFTTCVDSFRRKTLEKNEEQARALLCRAHVPRLCAACTAARVCRVRSGVVFMRHARADAMRPRLAALQCVTKCCEKFLKHSARISVRFAELNAGQEQPK